MTRLYWMRLLTGLSVIVLFTLHALRIYELPFLEKLEHLAYDSRVKIAMPGTQDTRIVIVDIDEKSLARVGRWPWGRHQMAVITENLFNHYRVLALGFDLIFAERDESSGLQVLDRLAQGAMQNQPAFLLEYNRMRPALERDERFARSLRGRPVLLGFYFRPLGEQNPTRFGALPDPVITLEELGQVNLPLVKASGFGANLPVLRNAAQNGGFLDNPLVDPDGVHRSLPLLQEFEGRIYQSLTLSLVRTILADPPVTLGIGPTTRRSLRATSGLEWLGLGPHHIPVDEQAAILIPYRGPPGSFPYLSAVDILDKKINPALLNDAIVLVGSTAPGLMDLRVTPVHPVFPGVEIHANIISGMLDGTIKRRAPYYVWLEVGSFLVIGALMLLLAPRLSPVYGLYIACGLWIVIAWSNALFWRRGDMVIPMASPTILTLVLFFIHSSFGVVWISWRNSKRMRLFAQHLPAARLNQLHRSGDPLTTRVRKEELTVLLVNIRAFSLMAERLPSEELEQMVRVYLNRMTGIIHDHRGTLDRYMGDAIMAFWGAPGDNPHHAREALRCALEMLRVADELKDEFQTKGWPSLRISIGMNSGEMQVGDLGSDFRPAFTVAGEAVNQARRLETLTKRYGLSLVVGSGTCQALPEVIFRDLDRIRPRGMAEAVTIFSPEGFVNEVGADARTALDTYHQALACYRDQNWEEARQRFRLLLERDPEQSIYELYLARIRHLAQRPPGPGWDGVFPPAR
ncbi:MAG: adenylate/guanylate cyclase domain-containing protein [Magnetococcales bacterium]|nr:adenylate/guanylate cyclase domain-containing protein [Magnetococcales bacterium]